MESPFEKQFGRKPNTVKDIVIEKPKIVSEQELDVGIEEFPRDADSTILVRERSRGTKLENAFKKKEGRIVGTSKHNIQFLPKRGKSAVRYSKRDVAEPAQWKCM